MSLISTSDSMPSFGNHPMERISFFQLPPPRDSRLENMAKSITYAIDTMTSLRSELEKLSSSTIQFLAAGKEVSSHITSLYFTPPTAVESYTKAHQRLFDIAAPLYTKTFTSELLLPVQDWLDDCEELLYEFGSAQLSCSKTNLLQEKLQELYARKLDLEADERRSKIFNSFSKRITEIDRSIADCKARYGKESFVDEGLFRGIEKSFQYVMSTRAMLCRDILASLTSFEFRLMKETSSFSESFRLAFEASIIEPSPLKTSDMQENHENSIETKKQPPFGKTTNEFHPKEDLVGTDYSQAKYSYSDVRIHARSVSRTLTVTSRSSRVDSVLLANDDMLHVWDTSKSVKASADEYESTSESRSGVTIDSSSRIDDNLPLDDPISSNVNLNDALPRKHCVAPSNVMLDVPVQHIPVNSVKGSIWETLLSTTSYLDPATDDLCSKFAIREDRGKEDIEGIWARSRRAKRATWTTLPTSVKSLLANSPSETELLEGARKHEVEAGLAAISMTAEEAAAAIYNLDLRSCRRRLHIIEFIYPSVEESNIIIQNMNGKSPNTLSNASRFHYLVSQDATPTFPERLRCLSNMTCFYPVLESLQQEYSFILDAMLQVRESTSLAEVFAVVLEFINFLNARKQEPHYGFTLQYLSQLSDIKTSERGVSLLDCIASHISKYYPDLLKFSTSLSKLSAAVEVDIVNLDHKLESLNHTVSLVEELLQKDMTVNGILRSPPSTNDSNDDGEDIDLANSTSIVPPITVLESPGNGTVAQEPVTPDVGKSDNKLDGPLPIQIKNWLLRAKDDISVITTLREKLVGVSSTICKWLCLDVSEAEQSADNSSQINSILSNAFDALRIISTFIMNFNKSVDALTLAAHDAQIGAKRFVVNLKDEEEREEKERISKFMKQFMPNEEISLASTTPYLRRDHSPSSSKRKLVTSSPPITTLQQASSHTTFSRSRISIRRLPFSAHFTYSGI